MMNKTNIIFKITLLIGLLGLSNVTFANNQAKINLAKKAINTGQVSPYATPNFKKLIKQAKNIAWQVDGPMGCSMSEHYYLGHGQDPMIRKVEAYVLKDGTTMATFLNNNERISVNFKMVCKGNSCQINDVSSEYGSSLRRDAQTIINTYDCPQ